MAGADTTVATDPANTQKRAFPTLNSLGWIDLVVAMNVSLGGPNSHTGSLACKTIWILLYPVNPTANFLWHSSGGFMATPAIYGLSTSLENPWYIAVLLQSKVEKILVEPRYRVR